MKVEKTKKTLKTKLNSLKIPLCVTDDLGQVPAPETEWRDQWAWSQLLGLGGSEEDQCQSVTARRSCCQTSSTCFVLNIKLLLFIQLI